VIAETQASEPMKFNYVIVGSGLTGAVFARLLTDAGESVVVLDRRVHLGGNVADEQHSSGIRIHTYGPHYFRTVSDSVWQFVNRFSHFHPYRHQVKSLVDGRLENWPIAESYIRRVCGDDWRPAITDSQPDNFEDAALSLMPRVIYEKFVKGYTEKQWGVPARKLAAQLCKRFDVRHDDNPLLTPKAKHQGIPADGYTAMMRRMLDGIPLRLGVDYLSHREEFRPRKLLIFTGPIDEYFDYEIGELAYRGQRRETTYVAEAGFVHPSAQINNPGDGAHIRDIEWKHLMPLRAASSANGTVITRETPFSPDDPQHYEYPFPDEINRTGFRAYQGLAEDEPGVLICGRLGEYRYFDMDHAIARAMELCKRILTRSQQPGELTKDWVATS
jgi:UDP-galactopyranose mutase